MKCPICCKRKPVVEVSDAQFGDLTVCRKCAKLYDVLTPNEVDAIERDAERQTALSVG